MVDESLTPAPPMRFRASRLRMVARLILFLYWGALFYATHMPIPPGMLPGNSDKTIHFVAYCGLGFLLMAWQSAEGALVWPRVLALWLILAGYGVFDELTQLLVNRNADLHDWLYDLAGAATGLGLFSLILWYFRPKLHESF